MEWRSDIWGFDATFNNIRIVRKIKNYELQNYFTCFATCFHSSCISMQKRKWIIRLLQRPPGDQRHLYELHHKSFGRKYWYLPYSKQLDRSPYRNIPSKCICFGKRLRFSQWYKPGRWILFSNRQSFGPGMRCVPCLLSDATKTFIYHCEKISM